MRFEGTMAEHSFLIGLAAQVGYAPSQHFAFAWHSNLNDTKKKNNNDYNEI